MSEKIPLWPGMVQGIVAVALGLFLLIGGDTASKWVGLVAAIYLVVAGAIQTFRGIRLRSAHRGSTGFYRGLVGLVIGLILLLMAILDVGTLRTGYTFLAIALIVFGALGVFTSFFERGDRGFGWGPVLVNLALLVLGILVFVARVQDINLQLVGGIILILVGAVILVWTYYTREDEFDEASAVP